MYWYSQRGQTLHRDKWRHYRGPIPSGFCVHHVNGDPLDNRMANLACMPQREHSSMHMREPENIERARATMLQLAHPAARLWHGSPDGRAWHREHAIAIARDRPLVDCACVVCGRGFRSKVASAQVCGRNCYSKQRRESHLDDEIRQCPWCRRDFTTNRYAKPGHCSKSCSTSAANARRRAARLQPDR